MKRTKEEVDKLLNPIFRTAEIRIEARSIKGGEFTEWYSALNEDERDMYKGILDELSISSMNIKYNECPNCREPIPIPTVNI